MSMFARERMEAMLQGRVPMPGLLAMLLAPAATVQRLGMARRLAAPSVHIAARVVSVGNLTLGGTGKTPAVIARAEAEIARGRRVALITRGYHAERTPEPTIYPNTTALRAATPELARLAQTLGDEAALVAWRVPGCAVVKGRDRVAAARVAVEQLGCDLLLLDDAFQYVRLARDENVLLVDATCPFGNRRVFPAGYLREPVEAAARATEILLTRCDQSDALDALEAELDGLAPAVPRRRTCHAPEAVVALETGEALPMGWLSQRRVRPACGIGNPQAFLRTLEGLGALVESPLILPDHGRLPAGFDDAALPLVLTEKDAVKLDAPLPNAFALRVRLRDF